MNSYRIVYPDELNHHGVKGMKWGVRKESKTSSRSKTTNIKKAAIIGATVIGVSAAAYCMHRYGNMHLDKVIKKGTPIQHMSRYTNEILDKPFYASHLRGDNKVYAKNNLFNANWKTKMTITSSSDLKIAGRKTAEKTYKEWLKKNPDAMERFGKQSYYSFNRNLNSPDMFDKKHFDSFYKELKSKGYDAIRDANDQTQTGTLSPIIIFGSLGNLKVSEIAKAKKKGL